MRIVLAVLFLLCLSVPASAQSEECNTSAPASVNTKVPFGVGFCFDGKDADGNPTTLTAAKLFVDGALKATLPNPVAAESPNAAGLSYYRFTGISHAKGARTATVTLVSADGESEVSAAYTFSVVGAPPSKPVAVRVEPR